MREAALTHAVPAAADAPRRGAAEPAYRALGVAVVLPSRPSAWALLALRLLEQADFAQVAAVTVLEEGGRRRDPPAFRLYEWLDRRLLGVRADALEQVEPDRAPIARPATVDEVAERLTAASADVILDLAGLPALDALAGRSRYGVWSLQHGDRRRYRGGPPFFWEAHTGDPVTASELRATYVEDGAMRRRVLSRSYAATDGLSLQRSRNATLWKTAHLPIRGLRDLHRDGWPRTLARAPADGTSTPVDPASGGDPSGLTMLRHVLRVAYRFMRHELGTKVYTGQWFVALRERSGDQPPLDPAGSPLTPVFPPRDRFYADPFVLEHDGVRCIFFEDYPLRTAKGLISCVRVGPGNRVSAPAVVLEHDCHLSYPFVFEWEGEAYMIPETGGARTVELYRARRFPDEWVRERILLRDVVAYDSTLLVHEGRFWLFAVVPVEGGTAWDELSLFWADSLLGPWHPHPRNPVVSDARRARPAGRIFELGGALVRPGQDCTGRYGQAITLNRIDLLTTDDYRERPVERIDPSWTEGIAASHCYDRDGKLEVVDGCRRVGRGRWGRLLPGVHRGADGD